MLQLGEITPEVFVAAQPLVTLGSEEVSFLKEKVADSPRKRIRICAHTDNADSLHEMLIVFTRDSYVRPSKHVGKEESLHVIEGTGDYVFFDDAGNVTDVVPLGDYASGRRFYCRIPSSVNHALILHSDLMAIHEATEGPFDRADTVFAPWSPDEGDADGVTEYVTGMRAAADEFLARRG